MYGTAEFQPGMGEVEDEPTPIATLVSTPSPSVPVVPVTETPADHEDAVVDASATEREGLSLMQKALFLGVIFGAVAVYVRMNSRSTPRGVYSRV